MAQSPTPKPKKSKRDKNSEDPFKEPPKINFALTTDILETLGIAQTGSVTIDELIDVVTSNKVMTESSTVTYFFICYPNIPLSGSQLADLFLNSFLKCPDDVPRRSRILSALNLWVDQWDSFVLEIGSILTKIKSICHILHKTNDNKFLSFFEVLINKILNKQNADTKNVLITSLNATRGIQPIAWIDARPQLFAQQLTIYHFSLFQQVSSVELLKPPKPTERGEEPLLKFIGQFNLLSLWCKTVILKEPEIKKRKATIKKLIEVCESLRQLRSFNALFGIMAALSSTPISRLTETWNGIDLSSFQKLQEVVSPSSNFSVYRTEIQDQKTPAIPFLGKHMSDLLHMQDALDDQVDNKINLMKHFSMGKIVHDVLQFKTIEYATIEPKQDYLHLIHTMDQFAISNDDEIWRLSHELEAKKQKMKKLVVTSSDSPTEKNTESDTTEVSLSPAGSSSTIVTINNQHMDLFLERERKLCQTIHSFTYKFQSFQLGVLKELEDMKSLVASMSKQMEQDQITIHNLQHQLANLQSKPPDDNVDGLVICDPPTLPVSPPTPTRMRRSMTKSSARKYKNFSYSTLLVTFLQHIANENPDIVSYLNKARANAEILNITTIKQLEEQASTKQLFSLGFPFLVEPYLQELLNALKDRDERDRESAMNKEVLDVMNKVQLDQFETKDEPTSPGTEEEPLGPFLQKIRRKSFHGNLLSDSKVLSELSQLAAGTTVPADQPRKRDTIPSTKLPKRPSEEKKVNSPEAKRLEKRSTGQRMEIVDQQHNKTPTKIREHPSRRRTESEGGGGGIPLILAELSPRSLAKDILRDSIKEAPPQESGEELIDEIHLMSVSKHGVVKKKLTTQRPTNPAFVETSDDKS